MLKPDAIADEVEINGIEIVGRYALNFRWSDGHATGIYSFQYLRDLCVSNSSEESFPSLPLRGFAP